MKRLLKHYWDLIKESRGWLFFVMILAGVWLLLGAVVAVNYPETFVHVLDYIQRIYQDILAEADDGTSLGLTLAILGQNVKSVLLSLFLGVFFGFVPVVSIMFNFFLIGYLSGPSVYPVAFDIPSISFIGFLLLILPHGIFEIPAVILATGFGIRLGWGWILTSGNRWQKFKTDLLAAFKILPLILTLLVIAAFVEAFITGSF